MNELRSSALTAGSVVVDPHETRTAFIYKQITNTPLTLSALH